MAQVCWLGPRVGGRLVLFCIRRVNRVYVRRPCSDFVDMLRRLINNCRIIIIYRNERCEAVSSREWERIHEEIACRIEGHFR